MTNKKKRQITLVVILITTLIAIMICCAIFFDRQNKNNKGGLPDTNQSSQGFSFSYGAIITIMLGDTFDLSPEKSDASEEFLKYEEVNQSLLTINDKGEIFADKIGETEVNISLPSKIIKTVKVVIEKPHITIETTNIIEVVGNLIVCYDKNLVMSLILKNSDNEEIFKTISPEVTVDGEEGNIKFGKIYIEGNKNIYGSQIAKIFHRLRCAFTQSRRG